MCARGVCAGGWGTRSRALRRARACILRRVDRRGGRPRPKGSAARGHTESAHALLEPVAAQLRLVLFAVERHRRERIGRGGGNDAGPAVESHPGGGPSVALTRGKEICSEEKTCAASEIASCDVQPVD